MTAGGQPRYWLAGALLAGLLLYFLRGVMLPFVAGLAVAYFLDPVVDRFEAWKLSRTLATSVVTALFFVVLIVAVILVVPVVHDQAVGFSERLPSYIERVRELLLPLVEQGFAVLAPSSVSGAVADVAFEAMNVVGSVLAGVWSGGLVVINILSLIFITPVVAFYLLRDWDRIVARVDSWLPRRHAAVIRQLAAEIDAVLAGFVRGTGTVCLGLGVFYALALTLVGLDFGLIVGLAAGLISFVPFVGSLVGLVLSGAIALFQFWPDYPNVLVVIVIFAVGQFIEGNFLTPKFVGDRIKVHPVWIIFALLAGGVLFGFVGVLLAVPATATVGVVARFGVERYLQSELYRDPGTDEPRGDDESGPPTPDAGA